MLQLLNPLWLWAIAGIIVPVIIHLWHIKTGKTLKIGSIALLGESARQSSRSFRVTNWPLMLLRCFLLLLLAFLLTEPFWQKQAETSKTKGWILIEKEPIKEVYAHFKPQIDSLQKAGYEIHQFDASFKALKLEEVLKDTSKKVNNDPNPPRSYWSLVKLLQHQLPPKFPAYLFTSNQLQHFQNARPEISSNLYWKIYTPADSVSTWIQSAYLTSKDSIRIILGNSKSNNTSFSSVKLQSADRGNSRFQVSFEAGKPVISLKNNSQKAVPVDTSTLKITVFQNRFPADAAYLNAALQAVEKFSQRKMKIHSVDNFNQIPNNQDWVFWLSNQNPPQNLNQKPVANGQVFQYENGKSQIVNSWISSNDFTGNNLETINLYQHFLADKRSIADKKTIWQDGFGNPILSLKESKNLNFYHFYSHFNPAWNDLVWSSDFPKMMLKLILKSYPQPDFTLNDKRIISENQLQISAKNTPDTSFSDLKTKDLTDLKHAIWIALFLVFLLERIISTQTKKQEIYG